MGGSLCYCPLKRIRSHFSKNLLPHNSLALRPWLYWVQPFDCGSFGNRMDPTFLELLLLTGAEELSPGETARRIASHNHSSSCSSSKADSTARWQSSGPSYEASANPGEIPPAPCPALAQPCSGNQYFSLPHPSAASVASQIPFTSSSSHSSVC